MMFGGATVLPPTAPARPTFGTAASNESVDEGDTPGEETILEKPGQSTRTLVFGTGAPEAPAPAKNSTMLFGKSPVIPKISARTVELAGMSVDEEAPNESTVRVDAQEVVQEQQSEEQAPRQQDRTQRYAMTDLGGAPTPPEARDPVQNRHNRTQLFAMSSAQESTAPAAGSYEGPVGDATLPGRSGQSQQELQAAPTFDPQATLPPDQPLMLMVEPQPAGVSLLHDPSNLGPVEAMAAPEDGPLSTTMPNLGAVIPPHSQLPPLNVMTSEPGGSPSDVNLAPVQPHQASLTQEDAAALRAARGGGAGRAVVVVLALVALALLAVLIYRLFGGQIMGAIKPPEQPVGALVESVKSRFS
jgi:hypothetical protein